MLEEEESDEKGLKKIFINAEILSLKGEPWAYSEGCLSIPGIVEDVFREEEVEMKYFDENFKEHIEIFKGVNARVILHEYDHIEGKLFTDYLKPLKKRLLQKKLKNISKGDIKVSYKMRFPLR
ncbi:UNVERIFIED_CONTAM: hypothetical protein GTU68_021195 [Idotea baltica]|nr:hypothetical protein [Idotea baltica]